MKNNSNPELDAVDTDLREWYGENFDTEYVSGLPIKIQIVRLLRRLLGERDHGQNRSGDGEKAKNDIQPENLFGKPGGGPLMAVYGLTKHPGQCMSDSALDLLVCARVGSPLLSKVIEQLLHGPAGPHAGFLVVAHRDVDLAEREMRLVDIPRLLGMIDTLREATKSSQPASAVPTEGKA